MKNIAKAIIVLVFLFLSFIVEPKNFLVNPAINSTKKISHNELKKLAVEKGIIPNIVTNDLLQSWQGNGESVLIWIVSPRSKKMKLIKGLKRIHQSNEVDIKKTEQYYIYKINLVIFENIRKGNVQEVVDKGIVGIFRDIAIFEGLYDDGMPAEENLKNNLGKERFEKYKEKYPHKYKEMLNYDKIVN